MRDLLRMGQTIYMSLREEYDWDGKDGDILIEAFIALCTMMLSMGYKMENLEKAFGYAMKAVKEDVAPRAFPISRSS